MDSIGSKGAVGAVGTIGTNGPGENAREFAPDAAQAPPRAHSLEDAHDYPALLTAGTVLLDVRSPGEFARGAFPNAVNLPILDDAERAQVGLCYAREGQQAAIALGMKIVSGTEKQRRVQAWVDLARANAGVHVYCWRGGLRSGIARQWLAEAGVATPRIAGGFKAMRGFLLAALREAAQAGGHLILGGMTGTGKTEVLRELPHAIDLEAHANHRGSGFGKRATPQPAQIDFEHRVAIDILTQQRAGLRRLVLEDESRLIGANALPLELHEAMQTYPVVWLEADLEARVDRILRDYVVDLCAEFVAAHGLVAGREQFSQRLLASLDAIAKRLGGERHARLKGHMQAALAVQAETGEHAAHRAWIVPLLAEYYDPMYARQLERKATRIVFRGNQAEVLAYLRAQAVAHSAGG